MTTNDWREEIKKWKENQGGACACLGDCEVCGYHKCHGCICNLTKVILANYQSKLIAEIEGMLIEKAHSYSSENADVYRAYDRGQENFKKIIISNLRERIQ